MTRAATASRTPSPARPGPRTTQRPVRRQRRGGSGPGLEGQRRPAQLHRRPQRPDLRASFLKMLVWNFGFAIGTVDHLRPGTAGGAGPQQGGAEGAAHLPVADHPALRHAGRRDVPGVRDMFNTDFGLLNRMLGTNINWFGTTASAMFAILLVQLWLGYNYMFLVCTGALQSISADLTEAAQVDGAKPSYAFRTITFPAAAGRAGPAADRVVRLQLQQLQRHLPGQPRRPVPARQSPGRQHRHPHHLHLPARLRWRGGSTGWRRPSRSSSS